MAGAHEGAAAAARHRRVRHIGEDAWSEISDRVELEPKNGYTGTCGVRAARPIRCDMHRDYVASVKPDPALYLLALEKLGVAADEAIAFEDSPPGILAAKRAGLFCIAIPNPLTKNMALELADRRLSSLREFDLDDVLDIIAIGGGGFLAEPRNLALEKYILEQTGKERPSVLMIPTARGDDAEYVEEIPCGLRRARRDDSGFAVLSSYAGSEGGHFRAGCDLCRRRQYEEHACGVARMGRAGAAEGGIRERDRAGRPERGCDLLVRAGRHGFVGRSAAPARLHEFLAGSCCPHYDGEVERRPAYHAYFERGDVKPGYAIEDGAAAHFRHGRLERVVSKRAGARAYYVSIDHGTVNERALDVTLLPAA